MSLMTNRVILNTSDKNTNCGKLRERETERETDRQRDRDRDTQRDTQSIL